MNVQDLTQTLVQSFNALANEVQNLNDRQVVLEHKLRYAHEQVRPHLTPQTSLSTSPKPYSPEASQHSHLYDETL